jgi:hypothetical protein
VGALAPWGPPAADERWARAHLRPGEAGLWDRMGGPDRRHAVAVAREVERRLGPLAPDVAAAALLHDVGKVEAGLGTLARVPATLLGAAGGRARWRAWAARRGPLGRVGRYLGHDALGADLLAAAGAAPLTVAWTAEHHRPSSTWTIDPVVGAALKAADGD